MGIEARCWLRCAAEQIAATPIISFTQSMYHVGQLHVLRPAESKRVLPKNVGQH